MRFAPILALLTACASSSNYLGRGMYSIECRRSQGNCYEEAARVCPGGFDVMDGSGRQGAVVQSWGNTATVTPTYNGEMLVRCRGYYR